MRMTIRTVGASIAFISLSSQIIFCGAQELDNKTTSAPPSAVVQSLENAVEKSAQNQSETSKTEWTNAARRILAFASEMPVSSEEKSALNKRLLALKPTETADPRLVLAYVLVSMDKKQFTDSQKISSELLIKDPSYVPVRAANARMFMWLDKRLQALAELESLAKGLSSPSPTVSQDQLIAAASFLGLAVGYFEGPGKDGIKATSLKSLIAASERIPQSLIEPFTQSRNAIGEEYQVLVEKGEEALKALRDSSAEKTEKLRSELESTKEQTLADADARRKKLESSWAQAKSSWDTAWSRSQSLSRESTILQSQQAQLVTSLSLLRPPFVDQNGNVNQFDELRYLNEKARIENTIFNLDAKLNDISLQYDLARRNGIAAESQMNAIRSQGQRLGMNLDSQSESFAKTDKKIRGQELSAQKAEAKTAASRARQARSFSTYDDFNFHKEQSMLIDLLPKE